MKEIITLTQAAMGPIGRRMTDQAARYERYLILAQACGVSAERAKAIFEEEISAPGGFDEILLRARWRVTSGEEPSA